MSAPAAGNVAAPRTLPPLWALVSLAWLGPAILAALQSYVQGRIGARDPATWRALLWEGGDWLLYALLTPGVFWCARSWPLAHGHLLRRLQIHLAAGIGFCALWAGGGILLYQALFGTAPYGGGRLSWFFTSLPFGVAVYFAVLAVQHAAHYFVAARDRETQAARLSAEPAALRALVPEFMLQPLVENAISHGLDQRVGATLLRLEARREGDDLVITVTDDGPGPGATTPSRKGVGLANTRARLETLYGSRGTVELTATPGGGARAAVRLPYHEAPLG